MLSQCINGCHIVPPIKHHCSLSPKSVWGEAGEGGGVGQWQKIYSFIQSCPTLDSDLYKMIRLTQKLLLACKTYVVMLNSPVYKHNNN